MNKMMSLKLFGLVVFLSVALTARAEEEADEPAPPTEAEVKKMKIKQLKQFMSDRGLTCPECFEKNDFKDFVLKNRETKLLPSKRPRKVSKEPIEKQWKKITVEMCEEQKVSDAQCKPLWKVVMGSFEMHGRRVSKQMYRELPLIAKTSMGVPFADAMLHILRETLKWMVKDSVTDQDAIRKKIDNRIKLFVTECASDNPNPSYEILDMVKKGKFGFDEL